MRKACLRNQALNLNSHLASVKNQNAQEAVARKQSENVVQPVAVRRIERIENRKNEKNRNKKLIIIQ